MARRRYFPAEIRITSARFLQSALKLNLWTAYGRVPVVKETTPANSVQSAVNLNLWMAHGRVPVVKETKVNTVAAAERHGSTTRAY